MLMFNGGVGGPGAGGVKDSFWLQLEVCREYQRSRCTRSDDECKFAHPPKNVEIQPNGRVTACYDSIKGRCTRDSCKYMHPPDHLKDQLLINGRNHLALKNALIQQQQHAVVSAATAAVQFQQIDPRSSHLHQQHAQLHPNLHQLNQSQHQHQHLHHNHHSQQQQQQAALFQSAVAAAAAQHQQQHHEQHYHQQAVAAAFNRAAAAAAVAAAAASVNSSSISPNNHNNNNNNHHYHHHNNNCNSHLNKPSQQVSASQNELSTQQLPTSLAPMIAAFSMNPFMTPGVFSSPNTYAANQYAAAMAAAAAAAQAVPASSSPNHDTAKKLAPNSGGGGGSGSTGANNNNCQSDGFVSKTASASAGHLSSSSGGIIKAPPTRYNNNRSTNMPAAASVAAAAVAAAAAAAAAASIGPSGTAADPLTAGYYVNPAAMAASAAIHHQQSAEFIPPQALPAPISGCDSTSDQLQANAAVQAHYQAVLSAALNNYGRQQQQQPAQSRKSPSNPAQTARAAEPSATVAKVVPATQQQHQPGEGHQDKQTCDKEESLTTNQLGIESNQQQQQQRPGKEPQGHENGSSQVESPMNAGDKRIKASGCRTQSRGKVNGEEEEDANNNCEEARPNKRPHLDLSPSTWLSPASSSGSGSHASSDASVRSGTPSSADQTASSSPGQAVLLDKRQLTETDLTNKDQPDSDPLASADQTRRKQHNAASASELI